MNKSFVFSLLVLLSLSIIACKNNVEEQPEAEGEEVTEVKKDEATESKLMGKWDIVEVYRSGDKQDGLDDLYMSFSDDGKIATNMKTSPTESALAGGANYELDGNNIRNDETNDVFHIMELSDSLMVLEFNLMNKFDFEMTFKKAE